MARVMVLCKYSAAGARGVHENGMAARRTAVEAMGQVVGYSVDVFEVVAGGEWDFVLVATTDNVVATRAAIMAAMGTGGYDRVHFSELISPEIFDAARPATLGSYQPPNA